MGLPLEDLRAIRPVGFYKTKAAALSRPSPSSCSNATAAPCRPTWRRCSPSRRGTQDGQPRSDGGLRQGGHLRDTHVQPDFNWWGFVETKTLKQ